MLRSRRFIARLSPEHFAELFDGAERPTDASALFATALSGGATIRPALSAQQRASSAQMLSATPVRAAAALPGRLLPLGVVPRRRVQYRPLVPITVAAELALDAYLVILEFDRDRFWSPAHPGHLDGQPVPESLTQLRPMPRLRGAATEQPDLGPACRGIGVTEMRAIVATPEASSVLQVVEIGVPNKVVGSERQVDHAGLAHPVVVLGGPGATGADAAHGLSMVGLLSADASGLALGGAIRDCQNVTVRLVGYAGASDEVTRSPAQLCVALVEATESLPPGATICIPLEFTYKKVDGTEFNMPVESDQSVFNAVKRATSLGINVVLASGNDHPWHVSEIPYDFTIYDSGSIICGYADEPEGKEPSTSLYLPADENRPKHERIDCHTCGENVPTLYNGISSKTGGSSAATMLIGSIVSTIQSLHWISISNASTSIPPADMRSWLSAGCNPLNRGFGTEAVDQIGVLPSLFATATENIISFSLAALLLGPAFTAPTTPEQAIRVYGRKTSRQGRFMGRVFNATNTAYTWTPWPRTPASATRWTQWLKVVPPAHRPSGRPPWANTRYRLHLVIAELPDGSIHFLASNADLAALIIRWRALIEAPSA